MTVWHVVCDPPNWFVERDSRTVYVGDQDECETYIENALDPGDKVTLIEADGYRVDLNLRSRKRRKIRG